MQSEEHSRIIIGFIINNQGCTKEQLVDGVKDQLSRVPVYNTLKSLLKAGEVKDKATNRRDHRLFVDVNNPSILVPQQLEEIETIFRKLLDKSEIHWRAQEERIDKDWDELEFDSYIDSIESPLYLAPTMILRIITESVTTLGTTIWINKFRDKDTLNKLFANAFMKLASLNSDYVSYLKSIKYRNLQREQIENVALNRAYSIVQLMYLSRKIYKDVGMEEEIEHMLDLLWKFNKDTPKLLFPEIELYKWDSKYNVDDWRKVLKIYENNPGETTHNYYLRENNGIADA